MNTSHETSAVSLAPLQNVSIVLVEPKYPENIGASARCAMNMGFSSLIVIRKEKPDKEKILMMATHHAATLVDSIEYFQDLESALKPFSFIIGTTARHGRKRNEKHSPKDLGGIILPLLEKNRVAILFGPESRGLTNDDLKFCNMTTTIPTAGFSSLNLAQAVAVHCYEIHQSIRFQQNRDREAASHKLARSQELEGMYAHVEQMLSRTGFLKDEDSDYWMLNVRKFLARMGLRSKEVRLIRAFCKQFLWYDNEKGKESLPGKNSSDRIP